MEVIDRLDLHDGDADQIAKQRKISRSNLKVRRHWARQALKQHFEETCRTCQPD